MTSKRDRLRKAEKLLRQGRMDGAIAEHVAVLEEEPRDWATTNQAYIDRYRKALVAMGNPNPEAQIAARLSGGEGDDLSDGLDDFGADFSDEPAPAPPAIIPAPVQPPPPPAAPIPSRSLDEVFSGMRAEATQEPPAEETSAQQYQLGLSYRQMSKTDEAIQALESAARSPRYRFNSAVMLGRLYFDKDDGARAVDWLGRAAESPAPSEDEHRALLYHLGVTLERLGETAQALGVLMELQADVGEYRDLSQRVGRLSRVESGG